ncbi:PREDICTED: wiskott-Aldrich syndrome protein-like [Rhinopithecus bieti]|uniref:wiskott-Aldrich syndrome protein-like n=1 Tax=Rhinopithecus bieti TaxID=61621 RepID=UPI00083C5C2A|nr:PREDICTED: wiskott-Aldrich syndrome protein-like [Rhinopithecus bieti]
MTAEGFRSAPASPERGAGRSSERRAEPAAPARQGSSEVGGPRSQPACRVPIGRLPAALRPKGGKEARGCSRARAGDPAEPTPGTLFPPRRGLGDPPGGRVWCRRLGGCVGSAPPTPSLAVFPPPPRLSPALAPMVGLRQRSEGTRGAPRRPGLETDA